MNCGISEPRSTYCANSPDSSLQSDSVVVSIKSENVSVGCITLSTVKKLPLFKCFYSTYLPVDQELIKNCLKQHVEQ